MDIQLSPIARDIVLNQIAKLIKESLSGEASDINSDLQSLSNELKADGEDVTNTEVQAAMLSALLDADGDIESVDVSDVDAIKTEIRESKNYVLTEGGGVLETLHVASDIMGNSAFLHALAKAIHTVTGQDVDENKLKARINKVVTRIKKWTGFPAMVIEKAFAWIAKQFGAGEFGQKIAGLSGVLVATITMLVIAVYLFPSITSGILLVLAITAMIGKSMEIIDTVKKIIALVKDNVDKIDQTVKPSGDYSSYGSE